MNTTRRYRKKPVEIEALQWTGNNVSDAIGFFDSADNVHAEFDTPVVRIHTLEGTMTARPGDYIIKGIKGEFYPCKPDIFLDTYDPVGGAAS